MDFSQFILFVLFVWGFVHLNNKIKRLSETLGGKVALPTETPTPLAVPAEALPSETPTDISQSIPAPLPLSPELQEERSARWLGRIGILMLVLGVGFFLKYAFENNWIGPVGRVSIGIISGIALLGLGHKLRGKYGHYADLILGGGIGVLYLSLYGAYAFYHLIPVGTSFVLMFFVTVLSMILAVVGGTINLAVIGVIGGFLTPVLLSTGENHFTTLSLYLIILNAGVLGVSAFTKWTKLNYLTFFGTVFLFGGWLDAFYSEAQFGTTFMYVTIFFLIFLGNSVLHHFVRKESSSSGDLILILLNIMGYVGVGYALLEPRHDAVLGFFALLLAVVYLVLAYFAYAREARDRRLNLLLPGISIVMLSIAIPLQLSDYWVSIAWLVEAFILLYIGLFIRERAIQIFGWLVLLVGMVSMMNEVMHLRSVGLWSTRGVELSFQPVFNMGFFLLALGVATFYAIAALFMKFKVQELEWKKAVAVVVVLANLLSIFALTSELELYYDQKARVVSMDAQKVAAQEATYQGIKGYAYNPKSTEDIRAITNSKNTAISILWTVYALALIALGFVRRIRVIRLFGLVFFFVTAFRVLMDVWHLGQIYRIISFMVFGIVALLGSFLYVKYKHRLKELVMSE